LLLLLTKVLEHKNLSHIYFYIPFQISEVLGQIPERPHFFFSPSFFNSESIDQVGNKPASCSGDAALKYQTGERPS
jgi:hypothetical protein